MVQYGFYFDQSRCIGCNACSVSCKQWHHLDPGPEKWMRVYQWERGAFPDIRVHFLAISCYHCEKPLCAKSCPNGAIYKEDRYGAVLIDSGKCTGARRCWKGCPYGSIMFASDRPGEKASKCTMCADRLAEGKNPICVLSCSMRALEFGPLDELRSRFGENQQLEDLPSCNLTRPSIVFKPSQPKRSVLTYDSEKALALWKGRGPYAPPGAPGLFTNAEEVTRASPETIGRNRLVLKPASVDELMHCTTDDD